MEAIKQKVLDDCLRKLVALGCKFCVVDPEGNTFGELKVEPEKTKFTRRPTLWKGVSLSTEVANMNVGDVRVVAASKYPARTLEDIRSGLCYRARMLYGKGSCTAMTNSKTSSVEIMRIA